LAHKILDYIRRHDFLSPGDRVGVAVSGGSDSVALLRLLLEMQSELGIILSVVHLNHKLRSSDSDADQQFVADLARAHSLDFHHRDIDVAQYAADEHLSLETAARQCRYAYFEDLLTTAALDHRLDKIATGHTLDDQAETVLLRLIRGTGLRGLRAIQPRIVLSDDDATGEIIRPLLSVRRHELQQYLGNLGQPWREDATNADPRFSRNRVRHVLLPLLESEFNPAVAENLAELAEIAREEEDYWDNEVAGWMGTAVQRFAPEWSRVLQPTSQPLVQIQHSTNPEQEWMDRLQEPGTAVMNASISLGWLLSEPIAVQRRVTKAVADDLGLPLEFKHIDAILRFAAEENATGKQLALPLGWAIVRERDSLVFTTPDLRQQERTPDYE
jgi:tRNA(Ile)-lysidine synthase